MVEPMDADHLALLQLLDAHWVIHIAWPHPESLAAPHCTPLYYARLRPSKECAAHAPALFFYSDPETEHGRRQQERLEVGASVALETEDISRIRGASLRGYVHRIASDDETQVQHAREQYLTRHPHAEPYLASSRAHPYRLDIHWAKLTNNETGLGQHLILTYPSPKSPPPH